MPTLSPAYGRDYRSKAEIEKDLLASKDFILQPQGCYANLESFSEEPHAVLNIRYGRMTKIAVFKVSDLLSKKASATVSPVASESLESWMARIDRIIEAKTGLSHEDLPDIDYAGRHAAGESPASVAKDLLRELLR